MTRRAHIAALAPLAACGLAACGLAACGGDDTTVVFVTVQARPTVRAPATLHIDVANAGAMRSQDFPLSSMSDFPLTFTVTPTDRTGDLSVTVVAQDAAGQPVAHGAAAGPIAAGRSDLAVTLEPDDFTANNAVAEYQWISYFEDLSGRQVATRDDGTFVIAWENSCPLMRCDILGRRFGPDTLPVQNGTSVSQDDFIVQLTNEYTESPTIAAGRNGYLMAWMGEPDGITYRDVRAVAFDAEAGHIGLTDTYLTSTDTEDERFGTAIARADGSYVVVWQHQRVSPATGTELRARVLDSDGNPVGGEFGISSVVAGDLTEPHGVGLTGGGFVVVWSHRNDLETAVNVRARVFDAAGQPTTPMDVQVTTYPDASVFGPHVAATPDGGFVVAWQASQFGDPLLGSFPLRMRRFSSTGSDLSNEITVTPKTIDIYSIPSISARADGAIGVAWHDCMDRGDGNGCGIRFRLFHPGGLPVGDDFIANTTVEMDQRAPSTAGYGNDAFLVAWTHSDTIPPDTPDTDVRARVIYPTLDRHDGVIGALCGGADDISCGNDLTCAPVVRDSTMRCHPSCTAADGTACPEGGTCQAGVCVFE